MQNVAHSFLLFLKLVSKFVALRGQGGNPNLKPSRISPISNPVLILGNCKYHHNHMGPQINLNIYLILDFDLTAYLLTVSGTLADYSQYFALARVELLLLQRFGWTLNFLASKSLAEFKVQKRDLQLSGSELVCYKIQLSIPLAISIFQMQCFMNI